MALDDSYQEKPKTILKAGKWVLFFIATGALVLLTLLMLALSRSEASGWGAAIVMVVLFLIAVFWLYIFAWIISPEIAGWIAEKYAQHVFYPGNNTREAPPEFAEIRAKIARGDIHEALKELEQLHEEEPENPYVVDLMSDVYIDVTGDYKNAALLLIDFLKKDSRNEEDVVFVMKLTDVFLENGKEKLAIELLETEINKKYSPKSIEKMQKRLTGI